MIITHDNTIHGTDILSSISMCNTVSLYLHYWHHPFGKILPLIDMCCLKWTSHWISHIRLHIQCDIALRNSFSQNKSTIVVSTVYTLYIYIVLGEHYFNSTECFPVFYLFIIIFIRATILSLFVADIGTEARLWTGNIYKTEIWFLKEW